MDMSNLSDAECKTLVMRMLTELSEYDNNIKEEIKVTLSEIKKIHIEPTVKRRRPDSNQSFGT